MADLGVVRFARAAPRSLFARWSILGVCFALLWGAGLSSSVAAIQGLPFSRTYSLDEIGYVPRGSRLNFDSFGRVVVIHDGVYAVLNDTAWQNLADTDGAARLPMTEVVHAGYGRSYYAGRASWGLAEFGADGKIHARPLVPANPPSWTRTTIFEDVIVTLDGVYFASANGIVFWDFAQKKCAFFEFRVSKAFGVGNTVFVCGFDQPLSSIDVKNHTVRPIPSPILATSVLNQATSLDEAHALISSREGRLYSFDGVNTKLWPGHAGSEPTERISALQHLADGNVAIAFMGKGVFIFTPEGELLSSLTAPQYFQVTTVASHERGLLWLLTEDSVEKVLYGGKLTSFGRRLGLPLGWPEVASWNGRIFVASERVLYEAISNGAGTTAHFERAKEQPAGGALSLAAWGRHLLTGDSTSIYSMEPDGSLKEIARVKDFCQLAMVSENLCYAIGSAEIALFEWDGERWFEPTPRIPGLAHSFALHPTTRSVWIEMGGDGVARVSRKDGKLNLMVLPNEPWTKALWVNIGIVGDIAVLSTLKDKRRFFDENTETWCEMPDLTQLLDRSPRWLARVWKDQNGILWATHNEGLVRFDWRNGDYEMDASTYDLLNDRFPIVHILPDNDIWIVASRSLHHVEQATKSNFGASVEPMLVSLTDTRRHVELLAKRIQDSPLQLPFSQNSLTFRFFSGSYAWRRAPTYEFRLGTSEPWALIDADSLLRFPNLHEGKYDLQVRITGDRAMPGKPTTFSFEIFHPWHRTWPAYALYAAVGICAMTGMTRWFGRLARQRNRTLERVVRERTGELESAMKKLNEETRITATLAERDRLALEIHDSVQQGLSGAIIQLDTTLRQSTVASDLRARLNVVRNMLAYARQEVQHVVWDLDSPLLESNNLGEALRKLTTFTTSIAKPPVVVVSGTPMQLPRVTTHHLLRIAQEATTNAVRHAMARRIDIGLEYRADAVVLTISDDGGGFHPESVLNKTGHFGLRGIRSRTKKIRAELTIKSSPDKGTSIQVSAPLRLS